MMEPDSLAIQTSELTKRFGDFTAVAGVSIEVRRGEVFGLLGPNGAGKTTLVRMLTTLLPPSEGNATVAGEDVVRHPRRVRERIGVIPQALTSDLDLTGWENIDIYGQFYGVPRRERRQRAQRLLEMVGLRERANDLVATYSGGMRRRLEIARGLIHSPEVLFLDEPTIGLDPQSRRAVWDLLEALRKESEITISLTTHYMDEAEQLCDRIAIVDRGKIIALDTPAGLKRGVEGSDRVELEVDTDGERIAQALGAESDVREVIAAGENRITLSTDDGARILPGLIERVEAAGAHVKSISVHKLSLEDVFIRYTGRSLRDEPAKKVSMWVGAGMPQSRS
jgi:ABC-2 type transport system ATP-binding protein